MTGKGAVQVHRDGAPVSPILASADEAFGWILGHQPMSVDWAMKWEGYTVESLPVDAWPDDAADRVNGRQVLRDMAVNTLRHDHPPVGSREWDEFTESDDEQAEMVRDNCHACALLCGWGELSGADSPAGGLRMPNGAFPRTLVQAGRPIRRRYAPALHWFLNDTNDNELHRYALLRDLATWGVRFTD